MTDEQLEILRGVAEANPELAELLKTGNDTGAADLLNTRNVPGRQGVAPDVLQAALMNAGIWTRLRAIQRSTEAPAALQAAADTVFDACRPGGLKYINLDAPSATALFDAFEEAGQLSKDERTALLAIADTLISRAEELLGAGVLVSLDDVVQLRRAVLNG